MKLQSTIFALSIILTAAFAQPTLAWNHFGHELVAYLCYEQLTPQAKQRVNQLIKLNPLYGEWAKKVSDSSDDKDEQIFMLAATWPDIIKKDPNYSNDPAGSPQLSQNIGYSDQWMHRSWHVTLHPYSRDHMPLPAIPEPNAETQIAKFEQVLASDAGDDLKSYDLCWLMHLVGDIHEPMHCITRVTKSAPQGDSDGNSVKLTGDTSVNLHKLWDSSLSQNAPLETVIAFGKTLEKPGKKLAADGDVQDWITQSHRIAIKSAYQKPIGPDLGPYTVTDKYKATAAKIAKTRAVLAGARLANFLNQSLK